MGVLDSLFTAIAQLTDPRLRRVVWIGVLGSLSIFLVMWIGLWFLTGALDWTQIPYIGWLFDWMGDAAAWLGGIVFLTSIVAVSFLLFPAIVTIIVGFFLEEVVGAVEDKHYPGLPPARVQPTAEVLGVTVRFALLVIGINLLALPFYLLLMFLPPMNIVLYYLLNGYLVGREYYELVALRRLEPGPAKSLRKAHKGRMLFAGVLLVFFMTIPIINFVTPVVAAAFMVHVFQNLPRRAEFS
jgi:CysZ protein